VEEEREENEGDGGGRKQVTENWSDKLLSTLAGHRPMGGT